MSAGALAMVAVVGAVGALSRHGVDRALGRGPGGLPRGTLAVNLSGALALGVLVGTDPGDGVLLLAGSGFIGSFTTFSTWMLEVQRLAEDGRRRTAWVHLGASSALGLLAAGLGWLLGSAL